MVAEGDGGTAAAEAQKFAAGTFLKPVILPVGFHLLTGPQFMKRADEKITYDALKPSASHHVAVGLDGEMAVTAVAAVIDGLGITFRRNGKQAFFVEIEGPEMVFEIECGRRVLVLLELMPYAVEKVAVFLG